MTDWRADYLRTCYEADCVWRSAWMTGFAYRGSELRTWYGPSTDEERELVNICGVYSDILNPDGCSRDHIFPVCGGWHHQVPPHLLRNPANCRWITQADNALKGLTDRKAGPADVKALFARIEAYAAPKDLTWPEHTECLQLIGRYRAGERYGE